MTKNRESTLWIGSALLREICGDSRLSKIQLRVLLAIMSISNTQGLFDPFNAFREEIALMSGYSGRTISRATTSLVNLGWLEKRGAGGAGLPCSYRVKRTDNKLN